MAAEDVPFAPVNSLPEVYDDPQVRHLEMTPRFEHPPPSDRMFDHGDFEPGRLAALKGQTTITVALPARNEDFLVPVFDPAIGAEGEKAHTPNRRRTGVLAKVIASLRGPR